MNEPLITPTFPPKRGWTDEEREKIDEFIKAGKMTICPPMGSRELELIGIQEAKKWAQKLTDYMKSKLGLARKLPERTPKEQREHQLKRQREYHKKRKERE